MAGTTHLTQEAPCRRQLGFKRTQKPCAASLGNSVGATLHSPSLQRDNYAETPPDLPDPGH